MTSAAKRFFAGFYRDPDPLLAALALAEFLAAPSARRDEVAYIFVRAAQLSAAVADAYRALAAREPQLAREVSAIIAQAEGPSLDPMPRPILQPQDLDRLWAELLLSGSPAPVHRIAEVLERPDRLLAHLERWLRAPGAISFLTRPRVLRRLGEVGIATDLARPRLGNALDVDLHVWKLMRGGFQVRSELPFALSDDDVMHMALKGVACWSMQSNAQQHEVVAEVYATLSRERFPSFV